MATIREHVAHLIQREVSFFNGWSVSQETLENTCDLAAIKVLRYLRAKHKVARQHKCGAASQRNKGDGK